MDAERRIQGVRRPSEHDVTPQTSSANNVNDKLPPTGPYDLRLTVVSASHIPIADLRGSSDAYIIGKVKNVKGLIPEDPKASRVHFRTPTNAATRDPEWREKWRFGGVREGTYIKLKLFDEDGKHSKDDKLGSIKLVLRDLKNNLLDGFEHTRNIPIRGHKGKKHVQVFTTFFDLCNPEAHIKSPEPLITVNLQLLPPSNPLKTAIHLIGPTRYSIHYSPLVNLVTTTPSQKHQTTSGSSEVPLDASGHPSTSFRAYKVALTNPPPSESLQFYADMSHAKTFDPSKLHYRFLRHLVRKQYQNIYGHDNKTIYGAWEDSDDVGQGLVDLLQPVENKLFTFVITTNGEWRFCETGDEYKINHLSKHGMHSNSSDKVVWSGEFFIRFDKDVTEEGIKDAKMYNRDREQSSVGGRIPAQGRWKIYLDNDSGTYSPDKDKIDLFREFMAQNLKGIEVVVRDFKDPELKKAKKEQKAGDIEGEKQVKDKQAEGEQQDKTSVEGKKNSVQEKQENGEQAKDKPDENQSGEIIIPKRKPRRIISILKEENERRLKIEQEEAKKERRARLGPNYTSDHEENPY